ERRAGAAGDHDRGHQSTELADRDSANQVDRIDLGTELLELDRTLLRDDDSDEKAHQADDSERAYADDVKPLHHGIDAETARGILDDVGKADERRTEESEEAEHGHARLGDPLADLRNDPEKASAFFGMDLRGLVELGDLLEQAGLVAAGAGDLGMPIADRAIDDPCADRIH